MEVSSRAQPAGTHAEQASIDRRVTALVCTRNRADDVVKAVSSLLESKGVDLDLVVVDQSDGPETADALNDQTSSGQVRLFRSRTRGVGAALNEGLRLALSPIVIRTDDDCEVDPGWIAGMASLFDDQPEVVMVFCNVVAGPHDEQAGYVPEYPCERTRLLRSPIDTISGRGIGAGVGFRRDALLAIGGFDDQMGPGSAFQACEDWDAELRALLKGWHVLHTADQTVVHHGFRTFAEGRDHAGRDWFGIGACLGKLARTGRPSIWLLGAWELGANAVFPPLVDIARLRRPQGFQRIAAFCRGFAKGLTAPIDKETNCFA
jgi:glycosyltransferase involved in cell wall biosynthesis